MAVGVIVHGAASASAETLPTAISSFETDMGTHFTTSDGYTLYVYDNDVVPLESQCFAACAERWPPHIAADDAEAEGDWVPFTRSDDLRQWAYKGKPVYRFYEDITPRATVGDGVQNVWHIAIALKPRPPGIVYNGTILGRVITTPDRMSLYVRADNDCSAECLRDWIPYPAPWAATATGDWAVATRPDDGTLQWAWKGQWLFSFRGDAKPGETRGDGVGGQWHAALVQPAPGLPPGVTVTPSDYGPIFANHDGKTLYSVSAEMLDKIARESMCDDTCKQENWTAVIAPSGSVPMGNWSLVPMPDGQLQWAYRGRLLYTFNRDQLPGEIFGDRFAGGGGFNSGWLVIPQLTLREEAL